MLTKSIFCYIIYIERLIMRKFIITRDINDHLKAGDIVSRTNLCWMQDYSTGEQWITVGGLGVGFFRIGLNDVKEVF